MNKDFSIVFMGTPEFAVTILDKLNNEKIKIKAVVTAPDKPAGRGQKMLQSDVKKYALANNLKLLQPTSLKDPEFNTELLQLGADLFVVVAFRMLPQNVWSLPPKGTINLHASLLPNYRGAAPINWAIINGENETGVSTFFIEKEIDTGKIIEQAKVIIGENETVGELYERLMNLGATLMLSTINKIKEGQVDGVDQANLFSTSMKPAPKIFKEDCKINFTKDVQSVHNFCRGLSPYPTAWCELIDLKKGEKKLFKIYNTRVTDIVSEKNGEIRASKEGLLFPCKDYYLLVSELQVEGKRRMNFKEFLAGNSVESLCLVSE